MAETSNGVHQRQNSKKNYPKRTVNRNHLLRKRAPQKHSNQKNAVYVTRGTNIKALLMKCEKLLEKNIDDIVIHCMGAAIQHGINLSLQLCERYPTFQLAVNTASVTLTDDLEPLTEDVDYETQRRQNSALRIKVIRNHLGETSKQ